MTSLTLALLLVQAQPASTPPPPVRPAFEPAFELSWSREVPLLSASALLLTAGLIEARLRQPSLCPCDAGGVPGFDRVALSQHSAAAGSASDVLLSSLILLGPLGVAAAGLPGGWRNAAELALIEAESMALTASLTETIKNAVARPRPYAYPSHATDLPAYESFWSGHTSTSFNAVVTAMVLLHDSYPREAWPWIAGGVGLAAAATTGVLRVAAGAHFPSDVVVGALVGTSLGLAVPLLHRRRWPVALTAAPGGLALAGNF